MAEINGKQIGAIYALVNKLKLNKADVVAGASDGRTEHVSELSNEEANLLIKYLKSQDPDEVKCEKERKRIISMGHDLGYRKKGTTKIDMVQLDGWCVKYGMFKKKLNQHNLEELQKLRWQFKQYHDDFIKDY